MILSYNIGTSSLKSSISFFNETISLSLVQDNRAIGNTVSRFEQPELTQLFSIAYVGNESHNQANNYTGSLLTSKINLQELSLSNGNAPFYKYFYNFLKNL